jgi:heat-inducible transcriptional repressor
MIRSSFNAHADNLEEVVQNAVKVISDLTDYTSVAYTSCNEKEKVVKIDIFRFKPTQALLLIVTENTLIRDRYIEVPKDMTDSQIAEASKLITKIFVGKNLSEIKRLGNVIEEEFAGYREIFENVMKAIEEYVEKSSANVMLEGEGKILNHPEYNDSQKVKNFLSVVTSKEKIVDLLATDSDNIEINIKIGGEDNKDMPSDCSLVTATYSASGVKIGTYGVIGPLRMDYQKVVSVLEGVGKILEDMLSK